MSKKKPKNPSNDVSALQAAAKTFAQVVAPAMEDKLALFLGEDECLPDLAQLALLIARCARWRFLRLEKAEHARALAGAVLGEPRRRRDATCQQIRATLRQLRDVARLLSRWGSVKWTPMFLFRRTMPTDPIRLSRYAKEVCQELRELSPGQLPLDAPVTFDPMRLATELEQAAKVLDDALQEIVAGECELPRAQCVKETAKARFEADCAAGLRLLSALGTYAGKPHIANLVKRHRRRSR